MSEELVFYTNPMSRGRIVRWMLEEVGLPYRTQIVHYGPEMKAAEYRAINPMGKVPALVHNGAVVTEVAAICAYLADVFPDVGLAPALDDPARAPYLRWLFFAAGPLEAAVTNKTLGVVVPEERRGMIGYGSFEDVMDTLEHAVSQGEYVAGDAFSAADLYLGAQLQWGLMFGTIDKRPAFEGYAQRLATRPAAIRAKELDDAAMPPQA
jgi:glutathione S-transferase